MVLTSAGDGGAEVEAGAGHEARDDGSAGPGGSHGTVCAEKGSGRAADSDAEEGSGRHGESEWRRAGSVDVVGRGVVVGEGR